MLLDFLQFGNFVNFLSLDCEPSTLMSIMTGMSGKIYANLFGALKFASKINIYIIAGKFSFGQKAFTWC